MSRTLEEIRAARRAVVLAELDRPSWPPKLPLNAYPKRGPNGSLAVTIPLGSEGDVSLATVVCGEHFWLEASFPGGGS